MVTRYHRRRRGDDHPRPMSCNGEDFDAVWISVLIGRDNESQSAEQSRLEKQEHRDRNGYGDQAGGRQCFQAGD